MIKLTQKELIWIIKHSKTIKENTYLAEHLLTRKDENLIRNFLTWEIRDYVEKLYPIKNLLEKEFIISHEFKKHDVSILSGKRKGGRGKRRDEIDYYPDTIIELKFAKPSWILQNENDAIDKIIPQDNIWKGNYRKLAARVGKEGGVIKDLNKMLEKQNKTIESSGVVPALHHICILPNPHETIDKKYNGIIEGLSGFNDLLQNNITIGKKAHHLIYQKLVKVYRKQLRIVESSGLLYNQTDFSLSTVSVPIGKGFGVETDLVFLILSEKWNEG